MEHDVLKEINLKIKEFAFLDVKIFSFSNDELILGINEDLTYSHNFEIRFKNVFTTICNTNWTIDTKKDMITVLTLPESREINLKYGVEVGNSIFELRDDVGRIFYIIAEEIALVENSVKYY